MLPLTSGMPGSSFDLVAAARRAMLDNGFAPEFPPAVVAEAAHLTPREPASPVRDLRALPWSSIDNDTSRDLDQLEMAEELGDGRVRVRVAIADVDALVPRGTATDAFAAANTTSVYTGAVTFPMLPEQLSTDRTSLGEGNERASVVTEFVVADDGAVAGHDIYLARVTNHAKLAYGSVSAWLDGHGTLPAAATPEIQAQLRLQDRVAERLRSARARHGALDLETVEAQSVVHPDGSVAIEPVPRGRASLLIEDFMIAANVAMAQFLDERGSPSIRRVVRKPRRWDRIVALAASDGVTLPAAPDGKALEAFLDARRAADPEHFPDLSLAIVKLVGAGEYVLHVPGEDDPGHFGLAADDYAHSTAPNRRFGDLVLQRLLKAVLASAPPPYSTDELAALAAHCTERDSAARKVERQVHKSIAAVAMAQRIGETFDAVVTGVTPKGTFVRVLSPPIEGRVMHGEAGLDVGERVRVRLIATDPERGFIDFAVLIDAPRRIP